MPDQDDATKILPLASEAAASTPGPSLPIQSTAGMVGEPLNTLKLKPLVMEALATVYDPEIPVNIYELGLIYDVIIDASATVGIKMTLTAPNCPAAQTLPVEVREKVLAVPGVTDVKLEIVFDPPWDRDRMSDVAKLQLGMF
jgi:FeS assembly SUF system protein